MLRRNGTGGDMAASFEEGLDQAIDMLRRRGRLTYRALKGGVAHRFQS
jgi:hypothetical protein